jgi:hypothetical protein
MIASLVRFRSAVIDDEVLRKFEERADRYREVSGLVEKIYQQFREFGEYGALYVWDSDESLAAFRETEPGTIPVVYQVTEPPRSELADVRLVVRPVTDEAAFLPTR